MLKLKKNVMKYKSANGSMQDLCAIVGQEVTDLTLTKTGIAADAKIVGDKFAEQQTIISDAISETKAYADTEIAALVNSAPETLDTLGELAVAIKEHQDVTDALNAAIGNKANASDLTSHTGNKSNPHGVTKSQVGLGNVENKSSSTIREEITSSNVTTALGYTPYTPTEVDTLLSEKSSNGHKHAIEDLGITATIEELNAFHNLDGNRILATNPSGYVYATNTYYNEFANILKYIRVGHYGSSWILTDSYQNIAGNYLDGEENGTSFTYDSTNKNIIINQNGVYLILFRANTYAQDYNGSGVAYGQITHNGDASYSCTSYLYNGYTTVNIFGTLHLQNGDVIDAQLSADTYSGTIKTDGNENLWVIRLR